MAIAGALTVRGYDGRNYAISWTATQNISFNSSTVNYTLYCYGGSSNWYAERTGRATVAGKTIWNKTERVQRYAGTILTGSVTVPHDANGNASFTISLTVSIYDAELLYSGSANYTLDRIYRGIAQISDGNSYSEYATHIYNGTSWDMYQPYIYVDGSWQMF